MDIATLLDRAFTMGVESTYSPAKARSRDAQLQKIIEKAKKDYSDITTLKDKLRRRNMQIKDLKKHNFSKTEIDIIADALTEYKDSWQKAVNLYNAGDRSYAGMEGKQILKAIPYIQDKLYNR